MKISIAIYIWETHTEGHSKSINLYIQCIYIYILYIQINRFRVPFCVCLTLRRVQNLFGECADLKGLGRSASLQILPGSTTTQFYSSSALWAFGVLCCLFWHIFSLISHSTLIVVYDCQINRVNVMGQCLGQLLFLLYTSKGFTIHTREQVVCIVSHLWKPLCYFVAILHLFSQPLNIVVRCGGQLLNVIFSFLSARCIRSPGFVMIRVSCRCVIDVMLLSWVCCTRFIRTLITVCLASFHLLLEFDILELLPQLIH